MWGQWVGLVTHLGSGGDAGGSWSPLLGQPWALPSPAIAPLPLQLPRAPPGSASSGAGAPRRFPGGGPILPAIPRAPLSHFPLFPPIPPVPLGV